MPNSANDLIQKAPDLSKVPGGWNVPAEIVPVLLASKRAPKIIRPTIIYDPWECFISKHTINKESCDEINKMVQENGPKLAPVSIQGLQEVTPETTGSYRTTMWSVELAKELERLYNNIGFPKIKTCNQFSSTDHWQKHELYKNRDETKWEYVGVSGMLRYMIYKSGSPGHFCHYDASYIFPDSNYRTLISFVIYLSTNKSGATCIINDYQKHLPIRERNHTDWNREVKPKEIVGKSYPDKGSVFFFDHSIPHSVEPFLGPETRKIIRGDLIFKLKT